MIRKSTGPGDAIPRRGVLKLGAAVAVQAMSSAANAQALATPAAATNERYRIGVCDWMILKRQKLGAFDRAREIGVDGVEVDMGSLGKRETFESKLADPAVRNQFAEKSRALGLEICSIAMSGFYAQSFATRPTYLRMAEDCITTMAQLGVKNAFLPLGVQGDLVKHPELRPAIVKRLKSVAVLAEKQNVVIGLETALDARGEVELLDDVGSSAIRIYFNFANPLQAGRNLIDEIHILGKQRIAQIHCTDEDGVLLEHNERLDMPLVKQTLDDLGWRGWLVMERSRDARNARDVIGNYGANARFLKSIFQS
ncbi:sugar phosphate isomerase/epimerase [Pirellulales bacterium]|nr:sugar phosphate isomerase/epimerase [Pirellulales bacterium]